MVLVQLRKDGGYLPLTEGVVKRVVDRLRQDTEPGRGIAIDDQVSLEAAILLVSGHIAHLRQLAQCVHQLRRPH